MKLKYLGTAAAEGIPASLCSCAVCRRSRALGGKNLRTRSQALIDGVMMIDLPPDTFTHLHRFGLDLLNVRYWLITHVHSDHFYPQELAFTRNGNFAHYDADWHGIDLYGSVDLQAPLAAVIEKEDHKKYIRYAPKEAFIPFRCGEYRVTPLKANHGTDHPYIYLIEKEDRALLYAHDTGPFPDETRRYLENAGVKLGLVSLDCTAGSMMEYHYPKHMCLGWNIACREELEKAGLADRNTRFVLNHFSHNGTDAVYEDFRRVAEEHGFITAYDGLEIGI